VIPEDWREISVGEVCQSIVPGRNKPVKFDGDIPWITTPNIKGKYIAKDNAEFFVSRDALQESGGKTVPSGAVIINCVGEFGIIGIATQELVINQQLHAFVCPPTLSNEYLAYALSIQTQYMYSVATTTTIPYMNKSSCESIPILLPPLEEQRKIAEILSTWDEAIEKLGKLIAAKQKRKRALMQGLLTGKKRFKEFEKKEWKKVCLRDVVSINYGKSPKDIFDDTGVFPIYGTGGITGFTNECMHDGESIILGRKGTIDKVRFITGKFWATDTTYFVDKFKEVTPKWLYHYFCSVDLAQFNEASGVPSLGRETLYSIVLYLPSIEEQQKTASVLSTADQEIETLQKQLHLYKQQKRGLMQVLLTGKKRVKLDEVAV
jgi:type I restriction enzyme, S subunit